MTAAHQGALRRRHGVATDAAGPLHSPRPCEHCGKEIQKPRTGQRACSDACRFQLWKADQKAERERLVAELAAARAGEPEPIDLEELLIGAKVVYGLAGDLVARIERRRM